MRNDRELFERFADSAAGRAIQAEEDAKVLAARQGLADELEVLNAEHDARLPALRGTFTAAEAELKRVSEALVNARFAHAAALAALANLSNLFDANRRGLEKQLRASASPLITKFIADMRVELSTIGAPDPRFDEDGFHGKGAVRRLVEARAEADAQRERVTAAIVTAESYRLKGQSNEELVAALTALREGLALTAPAPITVDRAEAEAEERKWLIERSLR